MKSIEIYEKTKTFELQRLLIKYESLLEENELLIDEMKLNKLNTKRLEEISSDYEIDISLIRMELNRRLWKDDF